MQTRLKEKIKYERLWDDKDYEDFSPIEYFWTYFKPYVLSTMQFLESKKQARQNQIFLNDQSHSQSAMSEEEGKSDETAAPCCYQKLPCTKPYVEEGKILTDFGCGSAKGLYHYLEVGLQVQLVDIASNCLSTTATLSMQLHPEQIQFYETCLWDLPKKLPPCDYFVCADVMEHIPPDHVDATLESMSLKHQGLGFFVICLVEDHWGDTIKQPLHLSLFSPDIWLEKISRHWKIVRSELMIDDQCLMVIVEH